MTTEEVTYIIFECLVAVISISGNSLVIAAFIRHRRLRTVTNYFVMSLALADMMVGLLGIPLFLYSMITTLPDHFIACLAVNTWIMMLCTVSIFHLLAVSFDRYAVIVWTSTSTGTGSPEAGSFAGEKHRRSATILIGAAWVSGVLIGCFPLMGWNMGPGQHGRCEFAEIMDFTYLLFLYYVTIIIPTLIMIFCYASIYMKVSRPDPSSMLIPSANPGVKRRKLKRQRRVIFSLVLVVLAFFVCWYPLYTMNAVVYYCPQCRIAPGYFLVAIVLSHLSSAVNPFIYAYTMPGFKGAFTDLLLCRYGERMRVLRYRRQRRTDCKFITPEDKILMKNLIRNANMNNNNNNKAVIQFTAVAEIEEKKTTRKFSHFKNKVTVNTSE